MLSLIAISKMLKSLLMATLATLTALTAFSLLSKSTLVTSNKELKMAVVAYVVENFPLIQTEEEATAYMLENVANFEKLIEQAALKSVDMLVFPEYSITSGGILAVPEHVANLLMLDFVYSADNKPIFNNTVVTRLSDAAKRHQMYLVVNAAVRDLETDKRYNMALALDRQGVITACYRKRRLYFEEHLMDEPIGFENEGKFVVDSGQVVQLLICFDLFYTPRLDVDVDIVAYTTAWPYEAPFLSALQAHSGWARARGVTMLSANLQSARVGQVGSGVYGAEGIREYNNDPEQETSVVIVDEDNVDGDNVDEDNVDVVKTFLRVNYEDLSEYNWLLLQPGQEMDVQLDQCHLHYSSSSLFSAKSTNHALISRRGNRTFGHGHYDSLIESCALVYCEEKFVPHSCRPPSPTSSWSFSSISLAMTTNTDLFKTMPVTMSLDLKTPISNFEYYSNNNRVNIELDGHSDDLYAFALYAVIE